MVFALIKQKIYPRVHVLEHRFQLSADGGSTAKGGTIYPIARYTEALGDPSSIKTNPENSSFAEHNSSTCFPDSKVNFISAKLEMALTIPALETDKVRNLKVAIIPLHTSFLEDLNPIDEVSTLAVEDVIELQHETTNRSTYAVYNATDLTAQAGTLGTDETGLTTDTKIEGVTFNINQMYDMLQYGTIGRKLQRTIGRIKWVYLSENRILRMKIRIKPKNKYMNPYNFFGFLIFVPDEANSAQAITNGALTAINHVVCRVSARYNEWNQNFDGMR